MAQVPLLHCALDCNYKSPISTHASYLSCVLRRPGEQGIADGIVGHQ